jgi:hypothetical protein
LLVDQWKKTQVGLLFQDPIMKPFLNDFNSQLETRLEKQLGFNLDGIEQLPSGEVACGMIAIPDTTPGYVFTMDTADRRKEVAEYIEKLTKKLLAIGVKRKVEKYKDDEIIVFSFAEVFLNDTTKKKTQEAQKTESTEAEEQIKRLSRNPRNNQTKPRNNNPPKNNPTDKTPQPNNPNTTPLERNVYYLLKSDYIVISNQLHLIHLFADRIAAGESVKNSLADVKEYQEVLHRCVGDLPEDVLPMVHWYIEPLNYGESVRVLFDNLPERRKGRKSVFASLKEQGFDAIRGIGGTINIKPENREVAYRIFIHSTKPYRLAMRMFELPEGTDFTPPKWIPAEVARYSAAFIDPVTIFDNLGTLFDELVAQGEKGVFDDIIEGLKKDPRGPKVNIREEFIVNLGNKGFALSNYKKPITPESECIIIAAEIKEPNNNSKSTPADIIKKAVEKIFNNDPEMTKTNYKGYVIWHRVPIAISEMLEDKTEAVGFPELVSDPDGGDQNGNGAEAEKPIFPNGGVTVTPKYLIAGTNVDYLKEIIDRLDAKDGAIDEHVDFKATEEVFKSLGIKNNPHFIQFFTKTDESIEPTYEMLRQGKMPQSKALLGRLLNAILAPDDDEDEIREQEFNWNKLPEFNKVRHAFGPTGIYGKNVENGFFFEGFLLKKK